MKEKSFNIFLTTIGRPSLKAMVDSIYPQLNECDILTIVLDCEFDLVMPQLDDCFKNAKCTVNIIKNHERLGQYGHASRNRWQHFLLGDYILNCDDDDVYTSDAMEIIRNHCKEDKLYIFQMIFNGNLCPQSKNISLGNIGTPCGAIPTTENLPNWGYRYGGDFDFYDQLSRRVEYEFIDKIIYKVRPHNE